jgi:hypothetical protein
MRPIAPPDHSVTAAKAAQEADRLRYVHDVARVSPRDGLVALLDLFPEDRRDDVLLALTAYAGLSEEHGSATLARILMRFRLEARP